MFFTFFLARINGYGLRRISDDTRKKTIAFLWYLSLINCNNVIKKDSLHLTGDKDFLFFPIFCFSLERSILSFLAYWFLTIESIEMAMMVDVREQLMPFSRKNLI